MKIFGGNMANLISHGAVSWVFVVKVLQYGGYI